MCGIAGIIVKPNQELPDLRERLIAMRDVMTHRGPDDAGLFISPNGRAGLANRRLAIRDLSPAGHMPMSNAEGSVLITYNGEVYNTNQLRPELDSLGYRFRSASDAEVILHGYEAWGSRVVEHLRGMFAFGILDQRVPSAPGLFLARDRLGIKPLYYAQTAEGFVFASELKAMLASGLVGRDISPSGLAGYLMLGAVPTPLTIYRDIQALEPGHTLLLSPNSRGVPCSPTRYWSMPQETINPPSVRTALGQVRSLLEEAVRIRMVSDVPLGAFLSGGLDSSAVVALMRKATNGPIRTCSMLFEESEYSEARYARAMAEAVGAEHYERVITAQDVKDELDHILGAMDQPTIDGVNTYFVSKTAREAGLTVALSGLGGDELFGGYRNTFYGAPGLLDNLQRMRRVPGGTRLAQAALDHLPTARYAKVRDALDRVPSPASAYLTFRGLFSPREVRALVAPDVWEAANEFDPVTYVASRATGDGRPATDIFAWTSRAELHTYTLNQLLRDTDVMSMVHSLEVRVPLLDHLLVECVMRLPDACKLNGGSPKPLLRKALGDLLPAAVRERRDKQGFTFPFEKWLHGPLKSFGDMSGARQRNDLLQAEGIARVHRAYDRGQVHWSRVWALDVLGNWLAARV